jgi:hypothetical protein
VRSRPTPHRLLVTTGIAIVVIAFLALVILSPFALRVLATSFGLDWSNLSNIGQTYDAVSALITALALGGVVISLLYQARDVRAARSQAIRKFQFELIQMELEDADLMWASGAPWGMTIPADHRALRRHIFVHMWLSFWEDQFLLNEMSAKSVRLAARELFSGAPAREYWESVGNGRLLSNEGGTLQFLRIIDEEYKAAIRTYHLITPREAGRKEEATMMADDDEISAPISSFVPCAVAAVVGLLLGLLMRRRNDHLQKRVLPSS